MKITITAHCDKMKPAHKATVVRTGEGSNLDRAIRDGVQQVFRSEAFKGKRSSNVLPVRMTVQEYFEMSEDV
jgi:hypothetical protein